MLLNLTSRCRPFRRVALACGCAVVLALWAGCSESPKDSKAQPSAPPAAEKSKPADTGKAVVPPAAEPAAPAKAAEPAAAPAKPAAATDKPQGAPPPAVQKIDDKPAVEIGPNVPISTDADRDALANLIRAQAEALQKAKAEQERNQPPPAKPTEAPAAQHKEPPASAPATQPAPGSQPAAGKPGCGPSGPPTVDLTPLPPDQPQPKLVVKEAKVKGADVWAGKSATWTFELVNEGQAPLAIRLTGG
jgi:hypothetical protein